MRVKFSSRANIEVRRILEFYRREAGASVTRQFVVDLQSSIDRIKAWPNAFPLIDGKTHRVLLKRFPFLVLYEVRSQTEIRILAVRHQRQDPDLSLRV